MIFVIYAICFQLQPDQISSWMLFQGCISWTLQGQNPRQGTITEPKDKHLLNFHLVTSQINLSLTSTRDSGILPKTVVLIKWMNIQYERGFTDGSKKVCSVLKHWIKHIPSASSTCWKTHRLGSLFYSKSFLNSFSVWVLCVLQWDCRGWMLSTEVAGCYNLRVNFGLSLPAFVHNVNEDCQRANLKQSSKTFSLILWHWRRCHGLTKWRMEKASGSYVGFSPHQILLCQGY